MKFMRRLIMLVPVLVLGLLSGTTVSATEPVIKLGAILPFSGAEADIGREYERVFELAVDELGAPFEVYYVDSAGDPLRAIEGFHMLLNKGVAVVLTLQSWVSNAIYPLAQEHGVLHVALGSAVFDRSGENDLSVRFTVDYRDEADSLVKYVIERYQRVAIVYMDNDYGQRWARHLELLIAGWGQKTETTVVHRETYSLNATDFTGLASRVAAARPDVVVLLSTAEAAAIIRALDAAGVDANWVGTRPVERPEVAAEPLAEGLVFTVPVWDASAPIRQRYEEKYADSFTVFGAEGYDAMTSLHQAAAHCGADPQCLKSWYVNRNIHGVLGEVYFDEVGDAHYGFTFRTLTGGRFVDARDPSREGEGDERGLEVLE